MGAASGVIWQYLVKRPQRPVERVWRISGSPVPLITLSRPSGTPSGLLAPFQRLGLASNGRGRATCADPSASLSIVLSMLIMGHGDTMFLLPLHARTWAPYSMGTVYHGHYTSPMLALHSH